jgi:hypothetical protein
MGIGRAAFARPIEITTATKDVTFNASAQSIAVGTYACIRTLLYEIRAHMSAASITGASAYIETTPGHAFYGRVRIGAASSFSITWTDSGLATLLGFATTALSGSNLYTATSTCPSVWISAYTPSDRETWALDMKSNYAGQLSRTGELCGAATGPDVYFRTLRFDGEIGSTVFRSLAPSQDRTLESFLVSARTSVPTLSTNPPTKGFYYIYDATSLTTPVSSMTSGSPLDWTDSGTYQWCYPDERGLDPPRASHGVTRGYYAFDLRLHTGTAPTWSAP